MVQTVEMDEAGHLLADDFKELTKKHGITAFVFSGITGDGSDGFSYIHGKGVELVTILFAVAKENPELFSHFLNTVVLSAAANVEAVTEKIREAAGEHRKAQRESQPAVMGQVNF